MTGQSQPTFACQRKAFWAAARDPVTVKRALKIAAVVGTILVAINQGDDILAMQGVVWWKVVLTYIVPYSVSTYSIAAFRVAQLT